MTCPIGVPAARRMSRAHRVPDARPSPTTTTSSTRPIAWLTYLVPPNTHVTVLIRHGDPATFGATEIRVEQLAELVDGQQPVDLFEPRDTGVWIRFGVDRVCWIEQQYRP